MSRATVMLARSHNRIKKKKEKSKEKKNEPTLITLTVLTSKYFIFMIESLGEDINISIKINNTNCENKISINKHFS